MHLSPLLKHCIQDPILRLCFLLLSVMAILDLIRPDNPFPFPYGLTLTASNGDLLFARIADDGQWRFPPPEHLPDKYLQALVLSEDKRFYNHPGVDPLSLGRAFVQNLEHRQIVSGGSTLTMQLARLSLGLNRRTYLQKAKEIALALGLECLYSKNQILRYYAALAPFGGNTVGLAAACWRYFGKAPENLSWAEAAMLAVLPNDPASIFPGRNREALLQKRNRLLAKLRDSGRIDGQMYELSVAEPLPSGVFALPSQCPHLADYLHKKYPNHAGVFHSSLDAELQVRINNILDKQSASLKSRGIGNACILVLDLKTNQVIAYAGNLPGAGRAHAGHVDIIQAKRSVGSLLKPLLYARAMDKGMILPQSLLRDVPVYFNSYAPENFHKTYEGLVPAEKALARSLNVPFVVLLHQYGVGRFHHDLEQAGVQNLHPNPEHYGLTLILGGVETSLWNMCNVYAAFGRRMLSFANGAEEPIRYAEASVLAGQPSPEAGKTMLPGMDPAALSFMLAAMQKIERPDEFGNWEIYQNQPNLAWKTGTSYGQRDAWAIGLNANYCIGVWCGNANGQSSPALVGLEAAAPLLFEVCQGLRRSQPWVIPYDRMEKIPVCAVSGYRWQELCPSDTAWGLRASWDLPLCPYHQRFYIDPVSGQRTQIRPDQSAAPVPETFLVLSPLEEAYYRQRNPDFRPLPPADPEGMASTGQRNLQLLYPQANMRLYAPTEIGNKPQQILFRASHKNPKASVSWYVDEQLVGITRTYHTLPLRPGIGKHILTLVDDQGERRVERFEIIRK